MKTKSTLKALSKLLFLILLSCMLATSCDHTSDVTPIDQKKELTDQVLAAKQFNNLDISISSLSPEKAQFLNQKENSLIIPFKNDSRKGVMAVFKHNAALDQYRVIFVMYYEVVSELSPENIERQMKNKTFVGAFNFRTEKISLHYDMNSSKIVSAIARQGKISGRVKTCNGMTEDGGPLDCAGARLEEMNWLDSTICYVEFIPCMAALVGSCIIDDCNVGG